MSLPQARIAALILATGVALAAFPQLSVAQAQLSEQQIQMLEQLPPAQREDLLRNMGISPEEAREQGLEFPETVAPPEEPEVPEDEEEEVRLEPGNSLILKLQLPEDLDDEELEELEEMLELDPRLGSLRGAATYQLDRQGVLDIPGITEIRLAGLTAEEAAERVVAQEPLRLFVAEVIILPLAAQGPSALEPFGYSLFEGVPLTFAPATDVPVPADYVVGVGDELRVQLFGSQNAEYSLVVNRDGSVNFPEIGPISVAGLSLDDVRVLIAGQIAERMIGVRSSITLGELRSIRVFVLGEVTRPGSFTVSSLSTMTNALFAGGGVLPTGSLRNVQLKRQGQLVQRLDLYSLLLRGDSSADARLQPGDVIFVPPAGATVAVDGEIRRPAIYEIRGSATVEDLISMAGGLLPTAFPGSARIERIGPSGRRTVETLDLRTGAGRARPVSSGDVIVVDPVIDEFDQSVRLEGQVFRPGPYGWFPGMRISDLLPSLSRLRQGADRNYLLIRREQSLGGLLEVLSADLEAALIDRGGLDDVPLMERDQVTVFDLAEGRAETMEPLMEELRTQARLGAPSQEVTVGGMVRAPGAYPLEPEMRISDLLRAGASLSEAAFALDAELTRYRVTPEGTRDVELVDVDLARVLAGDSAADLFLRPFDVLNVKEVTLWRQQGTVDIKGEVRFPGTYTIEQGETLRSVIERAGGVTDFAFAEGSVFLREELKEREREQLDRLALRLENDLAALSLQAARADTDVAQSLSVGQSLLSQLRRTQPLGRLVINLEDIIGEGGGGVDVILKDGDELVVPPVTQDVTVIGEVQYSTSHLHAPALGRDDYISLSGGLTANADDKRIYVVRANGSVVAGRNDSKWFRRAGGTNMRPGDTIVVPLDVDRVPRLALWQSSTTILYNLAIAAAAIGSL
jgi:protein involved in polysaccharide export with SLBB domain